jgi:hypothetical protein
MAGRLAMASEMVTADCVVAGDFLELARRYEVMSVPKVVINETERFVGALPEVDFVSRVLAAAQSSLDPPPDPPTDPPPEPPGIGSDVSPLTPPRR